MAEIKKPMLYIRQVNIANGPQKVNNAGTQSSGTHGGTQQSTQNSDRKNKHSLRKKQKPSKTNYWRKTMSNPVNGWTPERCKRQSEAIRRWKPWNQSTGPKSPEGKAVVSGNAWIGGHRAQLRELTKLVNAEVLASRELVSRCQ